jgi:hypothetical protein
VYNTILESRQYYRRDPSLWPRGTLYPHKLALTSPTSGGGSIAMVRSRTQATEFMVYNTRNDCFYGALFTMRSSKNTAFWEKMDLFRPQFKEGGGVADTTQLGTLEIANYSS